MWARNAQTAMNFAAPPGKPILQRWIADTNQFNTGMQQRPPNMQLALQQLFIADQCICQVQTYITKPACRAWFGRTCPEFGSILRAIQAKAQPIQAANAYMIQAYPRFRAQCG